MSDLSEALAAPTIIHFAGKDRPIKPLDFNRLILIEDEFGSLDAVDYSKARSQRFLMYIILGATHEDLTEEGVGEMLTLTNPDETVTFVKSVLRLSGLLPKEDGKEDAPEAGKTKAAKTKA